MALKVSVIIPVYNQENLITKALDSIPERDDIEIIVIDDGSTDKTNCNVLNYILLHPHKTIKLLINNENKGVGYTVNKGYDNAKGEYVVLLGSDDYFYTNNFKKIIKKLDGTDLIYFNLQINNGTILNLNENTKHNYCGSTKFIRRNFLGNTRNPELRAREDWYFYKELLNKKPSEKFTNIVVKHYNFPRINSLTWDVCNGFK